jgi:hypothetical protein
LTTPGPETFMLTEMAIEAVAPTTSKIMARLHTLTDFILYSFRLKLNNYFYFLSTKALDLLSYYLNSDVSNEISPVLWFRLLVCL